VPDDGGGLIGHPSIWWRPPDFHQVRRHSAVHRRIPDGIILRDAVKEVVLFELPAVTTIADCDTPLDDRARVWRRDMLELFKRVRRFHVRWSEFTCARAASSCARAEESPAFLSSRFLLGDHAPWGSRASGHRCWQQTLRRPP